MGLKLGLAAQVKLCSVWMAIEIEASLLFPLNVEGLQVLININWLDLWGTWVDNSRE